MSSAQVSWLPDGRLHLHHGPIDMIVGIEGPGRRTGFERAAARFRTLLQELVDELPRLRASRGPVPSGTTARAMHRAVAPFANRFVTPMAAVAGAGAETILAAITAGDGIDKAHVNNGGDIAFHLAPGTTMRVAMAGGRIEIGHADRVRGIATSGWRGRSHSLGIADAVTVLARSAAEADAAATLIANAVDLPGHPAITRCPARDIAPESDLDHHPVTRHVGLLTKAEIAEALDRGARFADVALARGLIHAAALTLRGETRIRGTLPLTSQQPDLTHA
ncbi:UPF0280 family protein [Roseovarius sp. SCSIO 43702]|uniref:UPF0280 family protein n=1 Tax=Roseovarius sp. SCSIO 43702 TaxID=2823043 RepID=UPI001C7382A2|nr:UPF0280 family protein [Roseovarius sp. SCSIO 43702]QYX57249.1 UPF0280 family protein [Roseovarius sp. SCSIO 43702]